MSELGYTTSSTDDTEQTPEPYFPDYVDNIFKRLDIQDVEQFYKGYQRWLMQRRMDILQIEVEALQRAIAENNGPLEQIRPSAIALASLAQLQASGVKDVDLLDRMLERGEDWLDHTLQLLKHCEELDVIGGDYTQWCKHALDGAYDWIASMNGIGNDSDVSPAPTLDKQDKASETATEEQLLQKLMSEDGNVESAQGQEDDNAPPVKVPALAGAKITRELEVITEETEQSEQVNGSVEVAEVEEVAVPQESKAANKKELQVQRRGFWNFLFRVLAKILWRRK